MNYNMVKLQILLGSDTFFGNQYGITIKMHHFLIQKCLKGDLLGWRRMCVINFAI